MAKFYRIKPVNKKSVNMIYEVYKIEDDGKLRWFNVIELYRWGQGFRELDDPVYLEDNVVRTDTNLAWGVELEDNINNTFEFDEFFSDEEKEEIENLWLHGPDNDDRSGISWLLEVSDWELEDEYLEIDGPVTVDIIDEDVYNKVVEENVKLTNRPIYSKPIL